ncbi:cellulose synthase [Rhizobium tumorigenes]|uniref:Cellulose synthase n=1 Tax=Rhizobium tumorigenes TaxID=2041385 RepID=A0AAF1K9L5_9HYPH|nr:cellulose synthase [Rhizobium tumorigenes]WFR95526.1 cellulose synthase [Rhizobium tumorigenes]
MRPSLVLLSATLIMTVGIVALKDRSQIADRVSDLLGTNTPGEIPQLMRMGRISGPDFHPFDRQTTEPELARDVDAAPAVDLAQNTAASDAPATANDQPLAAPPASPPPSNPPAAAQPAVDESALRYFASRGDKARLQAEISRLQALYPTWTPPADPLAVPQNQDKQLESMWQLYSEARYAEVRKAISDRQATEPGWQPPADLTERLNVAEARTRLINASDLKQYETVVSVASETPSLLTCSEVDVLWRVADAFGHSDRLTRARDAYMYVMKNCTNAAERLATIQKASALLPYSTMQDLMAQEKPMADGTREFESIRDDLARRFVAEANADPKLVIAPEYLSRLERLSETQGLASDALLLGWYNYPRGDLTNAEKWFRLARTKEDTASASQGLALTLIARKSPEEAEEVMFKWRDDSKDANATYLAAAANLLAIDPPVILKVDVLQRIAGAVLKARDVPSAQQFGWYARGLNQPQTAAQWFRAALGWKADDEPSAYGLTITLAQLNDKAGVVDIQRQWAGRSERIATLRDTGAAPRQARVDGGETQAIETAPQSVRREPPAPVRETSYLSSAPRQEAQVVRVREARRPAGAGCTTTIDPAMLSPEAALPRAWCLMSKKRPVEAAATFEIALRSTLPKDRQDAAYGQSLAYLQLNLASNAAVSAIKAPQSRERALSLQVAILTKRASSAYDEKRYRETILYLDQLNQIQPEQIGLMVLRGYAYLNLNRYSDAIRIFEAAAATGDHDAITGLTNARNEQAHPSN